MPSLLSAPFTYWVGLNTPNGTDYEIDEFRHFYDEVHAPEVLANNPGFIAFHRFELLRPDPRGDLGPSWLAMYETDEDGAGLYERRNDGPPEGRPTYTSGPPLWEQRMPFWRMIWRRIAAVGATSEQPSGLYLVGMDAGPTTSAGLEDFNSFYTETHVPEILATGGYERGTRLQLVRDFLHPAPGAPRYCALYEAPVRTMEGIRSGAVNPAIPDPQRVLSAGPEAWETRRTAWRLIYETPSGVG